MRFNFISSHHLALIRRLPALVGALLPIFCFAEAAQTEDWNAKFQATYVWQNKRPFSATYSGANSLSTDKELRAR